MKELIITILPGSLKAFSDAFYKNKQPMSSFKTIAQNKDEMMLQIRYKDPTQLWYLGTDFIRNEQQIFNS